MTARVHRLAAICFADIAGYTKLSATNQNQALELVDVLQDVARRIVEDHGGRIVKFMGDAVLIEFSSTYDAVHSAIEIRDRFTADASSAGLGPRDLSIGVHVDDVVAEEDGDVYGDGVNIASRIQAAAEPGHVWVSEDAWRQLRQHPEFRFDARGSRELKGIAEPVAVYDVAMVGAEVGSVQSSGSKTTGEPTNVEPGGVPPKQSVAVLPFANLSPVKENEYFSDGVTEEILALLARIEGLKVISRTSIMRYKGTSKSLRQIGEELGAATILEGSVRQAGHRVRISAQLIDAATDANLWGDLYDRDLEDILAIQMDVAERIVEALRVRLTQREKARLVEQPPVNLAAYQANLRGRYFLNRATEATVRQAIEWFREAVEADPAYAQAWVGLAEAYAVLPFFSSTLGPETCAETRSAAGRALALDPGLGEAHAALGLAAQQEWRWDEAEAEYQLALELAPGYATAHHWYGGLLTIRGRMEEALAALHRALELDPVSLPVHLSMGIALLVDRRFDDATEILRKAIEMDPGFIGAHSVLAAVHLCRGRYEDALAEWEAVSRLSTEILPPGLVVQFRKGYASGGERGFWEAYLQGSRPGAALDDIWIVRAYARLGRIDEAFTWIEKLLSERRAPAPLIPGDPLVAPLHSDPRWETVLERMGLSDERRA